MPTLKIEVSCSLIKLHALHIANAVMCLVLSSSAMTIFWVLWYTPCTCISRFTLLRTWDSDSWWNYSPVKETIFLIKCFNYTLVIFISSSENKDSCELQYEWCHSLVCYLSVKLTKYKTLIRKQNTKQTVWRQAKLVTESGY